MSARALILAVGLCLTPTLGMAQELAPPSASTQYLLNTAITLIAGFSAVLFILAYGLRDIGLARVQNAPAVCLRMLSAFAVAVFAFWQSGYALAYSVESGGFLGEFGAWALNDDDPIDKGRASGAAWFFQTGPSGDDGGDCSRLGFGAGALMGVF